ncbi:MAG: DNA-3-methyladenine glycosylase family protein [Planctomycetota bacterium]|jgi:3-methyladenine DNA glycosylase/8-oxoguanine DNA glycosylase
MARPTPSQLKTLRRNDPVLAAAMKKLPRFPDFPEQASRRISHWQSLASAIVYQQLAGKAAATIFGRVVALTPGPRLAKPEEFLRLPFDTLRSAGLSNNKALSLQDLASHVTDKRLKLRSLTHLPDEQVIDLLTDVRGIGPWTAQMFLIFKLGRLDVLPSADLGVQEGLRLLDGLAERPNPKQLEARAEVWAPLRSVASWMMYRIVDQG